jgi:UDP-N-acetylglucosamine--N-acetylmuramyl-(pentapeptide) pyrophosphoryl-undecaprenol N-acetylglucosamine transferase
MKIVLTGGGTGGHFYPLIATAEQINKIIDSEKIIDTKLYFFSTDPYDKTALFENDIQFVYIPSGKMRIYFSLQNIVSAIQTAVGIFQAFIKLFFMYPDVIISKGGYGSFPTLFAARILRIPVIVHESDSAPGRVNVWASSFAEKVAVSFEEVATQMKKQEKVVYTGQPIREVLMQPSKEGAYEYLHLDKELPVLVILGGSQGAQIINQVLIDALPQLVEKCQIIHQTGPNNIEDVKLRAGIVLEESVHKERYQPFGTLNPLGMKMVAGVATIILSRAGSTIFEIAQWGIPSIIIPITNSNGDHQRKNAFNYARNGACIVLEEANLTPNIVVSQIELLLSDKERYEKMKTQAHLFAKPDAAYSIARGAVDIALSHEE